MEYLDRIAESYEGAMGEFLQKKSKKRIDWICAQVQGNTVLDIGCSRGICEVLLGRCGHQITGIDISQKSIAYAQQLLEQEPPEVRQNVRFLCADFIKDMNLDTKYDTVLLTEILEHLEEPKEMVKKASETLNHGGKMIVTVPFGINDFPDHKQTFYMANISMILSEWVQIDHVEYMDEWIGFCCIKSDHVSPVQAIDLSLVLQEEKCFFALERPLRDELKAQKEKSDRLQERGKKLKADYETMKVWFEEEIRKRQEQEKQLIDARKLSEEYEAVRQKCKKLRKEQDSYAEKYSLLANAKLGKLTIKYWETKKRLFTK